MSFSEAWCKNGVEMSGVDAAAGFAFQHARAAVMALDLLHNADADYLRVEAANDIVDAEMFSASGVLLRAAQFKRRDVNYTWGEAELVAQLVRWSAIAGNHPGSAYEFVTDGRLGPTGRKVREALDAARQGDATLITEIATRKNATIEPGACARAYIAADTPGFTESITYCLKQIQAHLPNVSGSVEAEERSTQAVLELLFWIVGRSGDPDPSKRTIPKAEIIRLLESNLEYVRTLTWSQALKRQLLDSVVRTTPGTFELTCRPTASGPDSDSDFIENAIRRNDVVLLSGPTGTGKSTVLSQAQSRAATQGELLIAVNAEDYVENRLGSLVAHGLNSIEFVGAYSATGIEALKDPTVTLAIDGVSEIPKQPRDALGEDLRQLLATDSHVSVALAGRDAIALRAVLPRGVPVIHMQPVPLNRTARKKILVNGTSGRIDSSFANQLAARVERALRSAADNPQLFLMGIRMLSQGLGVTDPAMMYSNHLRALADHNGYTEISIYEAGLGLAFANLATTHRRYCDSFEWNQQLSAAATNLNDAGHSITTGELRDFGFESGLIVRSGRDTIRSLHDSFADYLAAIAYKRKLAALPPSPRSDDTARLKFLAELTGVDASLAELVSVHLPFLCPSISQYESRDPEPGWHDETCRHLSHLLPNRTAQPRIAYWTDTTGRLLATVGGNIDGWIGPSTIDDVGADGRTFLASNGPLTTATNVYKLELSRVLDRAKRQNSPVPPTDSATIETLTSYSDDLLQAVPDMLHRIGSSGTEDLLRAIGPYRIQFLLGGDPSSSDQRSRPLRYRYLDHLPNASIVLGESDEPSDAWSGSARVDSFLRRDLNDSARAIVTEAINSLAEMKWL